MNDNTLAILAFAFVAHCITVYSIIKLMSGKPLWERQDDPPKVEDENA